MARNFAEQNCWHHGAGLVAILRSNIAGTMACAGLQRLIKPKHVSGGPAGGFIRGQGSGAQFCGAKLLAPWRGLGCNFAEQHCWHHGVCWLATAYKTKTRQRGTRWRLYPRPRKWRAILRSKIAGTMARAWLQFCGATLLAPWRVLACNGL